jgi:aldose 1-epimerase
LRDADEQLLRAGGYDHNVVLDDCGGGRTGLAATLTAPRSGRRLDVVTDRPGMQFYSGNFLEGSWRTVQGRPVRQGDALCLETQGFPDAVNQPAFGGPEFGEAVLRPGDRWSTATTFRFSLSS